MQIRRLAWSIVVFTLMVVIVPGLAAAQQSSDPAPDPPSAASPQPHSGIGFGIKGGPLFSTLSSAGSGFSNRTGLEGGVFFGGNRPGTVGVMGEILYAKKGAHDTGTGLDTDLYYFEIPILLRINVGSRSLSGASAYVIAGPVIDVKLKAKQSNLDVGGNYNGLDVGVIGGAGIEIARLFIEGRENWGLRNINASASSTTTIHTRSFAILFGVRVN